MMQSLVALAVCDILFLSFILLDLLKHLSKSVHAALFPHLIFPGYNILLCWEVRPHCCTADSFNFHVNVMDL